MTRNELIAAVALDLIKRQLEQEPDGSMRFCMLGLEASLVRSIAEAVFSDSATSVSTLVRIPEIFDPESILPAAVKSDQSITHWRHCRLPEDVRAVLFATSQEELQRNDKSVEKISKIETDTLRSSYEAWIEMSGLTADYLDDAKRKHLVAALKSANSTHAARTIETYADFVLSISVGIKTEGLPLQKAIDNALPSLKLPRYAGYFDRIPDQKRSTTGEWDKIYKRLHSKVRPLLVRETEKGDPIPLEQLRDNFDEIKDQLDERQRKAVLAFLDADLRVDGWSDEQRDFVNLDWRSISDLFDGIRKIEVPLGEQTIQFFDDEFDDLLDGEERELLSNSFPKEPSEDLQEFFESHREQLARNKKLSSKWERYIYRNPKYYNDFLVGILETLDSLRRRVSDDEVNEKKLVISIPNAREKSFWRGKNPKIARYFAFRYRGLENLLGDEVRLDYGKLMDFYFPEVDEDLAKTTSGSKEARSIKFEAIFDPKGLRAKLIFYWEMPVDAIASAMPDDLLNIANQEGDHALLSTADIARHSVSSKGSIQRISLLDVNTIRDVINTNDGKLVAPNRESGDRSVAFLARLAELVALLGGDAEKIIRKRFDEFQSSYSQAIRDWVAPDGTGINSTALIQQSDSYNDLLVALFENANNDLAREKLWHEILRLGVANVGAGSSAAIITPWHPLRLAEIYIKAMQAAKLVHDVLNAKEDDIYRADLLFSQVKFELLANYYPEVCVGFDQDQPVLLFAANTAYDYTLAEPPLRRNRYGADDALDIDPGIAARAFGNVGEQYLKLLPHERSNFSIVLYNAESKALPSALATELSSKVEQENELQCDLLLTHADPRRIRRIYEQQNVTVSEESGSVMASEGARNFLSRLRVGFFDSAKITDDDNDRAADLVALQDVVARNAQLVWKRAPGESHPNMLTHVPARWSRRRPIGLADTATSVYLACPAQPNTGQNYLNLIYRFLNGDNALPGDVIPAREVNFRDGEIDSIFSQTHKIGEWVVNFDELVDRRLLSNNGIQVIRHIRDKQVDRNVVVSTTSKPRLLRVLLRNRLESIDPSLISKDESIVDQLIDQANQLSGQVVMRAARYGHYANELLGIVLSMEEIRNGIGNTSLPIGWYFLDDFASWFGQREEQIADILAIAPRMVNGEPVLKVAISEAKFVTSRGYRLHAKKSAKQLEETVARLGRAIDPDHNRIDREMWLDRLGDFMIEGMEPFESEQLNGWSLHKWSAEVRQDNIQIQLAGFSHVFVHDNDENVDGGSATPIKGMTHCTQQVFDKASVSAAFRAFFEKSELSEKQPDSCDDSWSEALGSIKNVDNAGDVVLENFETEEQKRPNSDLEQDRQESVATISHSGSGNSTYIPSGEDLPIEPTSTDSEDKPELPDKLLEMWPSRELAEWVNRGSASEEDDEQAMVWLDRTVKALQKALRGYEMTAELIGSRLTPNAALVRFRGSDDLTVPKVEKKRQELLTSHAVEVINVLAAPMEVVIMVKRPNRAILELRDLWRRRQLPSSAPESNTSLLLGAKESDGEILYLNVGEEFGGHQPHGPHTLIAGETGSGKGVLVQSLLLDICATNSPDKARIRMIDPKAGIDFPWLRNMPHLDGDLITEQDEAIHALEELVGEMERRNRLLAEAGVTKLDNYNKKVTSAEQLPRIWLFHDELADWMMIPEYRDAVDLNASRLGVKARAAGINLILITQRPDKDALPMQLRANLTNRLVLKVADRKNSILVLDEPGAERLLGRGHLAAKLSGEGKVILAQVPFASEEEMADLASLIMNAQG